MTFYDHINFDNNVIIINAIHHSVLEIVEIPNFKVSHYVIK